MMQSAGGAEVAPDGVARVIGEGRPDLTPLVHAPVDPGGRPRLIRPAGGLNSRVARELTKALEVIRRVNRQSESGTSQARRRR
jgi:hypothetical protein